MKHLLRSILGVLGLLSGSLAGYYSIPLLRAMGAELSNGQVIGIVAGASVLGGIIGVVIAPILISVVLTSTSWFEHRLNRMPTQDIIAGALGLILGLIIAALLSTTFSIIPLIGRFLPTVASIILGYLGASVAVKKREDLFSLSFLPRRKDRRQPAVLAQAKILDTSVIIDGRIADVCSSGFLEGTIVIPRFVLEELRHIADSADVLKRNRGRRGLDILNRIQKEQDVPVQIYERDFPDVPEVDSKLIQLGKALEGKIITNDFNLNKVAQLEGVPVLNINELANCVKPVVLPGEDMVVHIIRDGKEAGQGVAYLDDGTMIVVDGGKKYIGETISVSVTSVLQTSAGRMIFARLRQSERAMSGHGGR